MGETETTTIDELREWLEQAGELEAAIAIQSCEIHSNYVDELVDSSLSILGSLFDVRIAALRPLYDPADEVAAENRKQIEAALRVHADANHVLIRHIAWVPRLGVAGRKKRMGTVVLYSGSGAGDFELQGEEIAGQAADDFLLNARSILSARSQENALDLLRRAHFQIYPAINHFNDDFHVLLASVPLARYEEFRKSRSTLRPAASQVAEAIAEAGGPYIRFVAIKLALSSLNEWSVFLCHTSEDKTSIVDPIARHLESEGIRHWYDKAEICWGDSIVEKIEEGLGKAQYVVVVVSEHLTNKKWAKKELRTALALEIAGTGGKVLPLLAGEPESLLSDLPFLREKRYLEWKGNPSEIAQELQKLESRRPL